jgi:prolyl 4-hydroxylase
MKEIQNFLTSKECVGLIDLINQNNVPSSVVSDGDEFSVYKKSRTSSTSNLDHSNSLVETVLKKISNHLGIDLSKSENLQGQLYEEGQYFKPHHDFFSGAAYDKHCLENGNRTHTLMVYLNDDFDGGGTNFHKLNTIVQPQSGKAVTWENMIDGQTQDDTIHEGMPVNRGKKYIITSWWREGKPKSSILQVPKLTEKGFDVVRVPENTWNIIQDSYQLLKEKITPELFEGKEDFIKGESELISYDHIPHIRNLIHNELLSVHRNFAGVDIEPTAMYGIRSYLRGTTLVEHTDRIETHHIASTILIDKDLKCGCKNKDNGDDWALDIKSHDGEWYKVYLEPGDMVIYESAICPHGRLDPFQGTHYRNFFAHYKISR